MQSKERAPHATVHRHRDIRPALVKTLTEELRRVGFHVDEVEERFGPQNAVEWALPAFATVALSASGAAAGLAVKKFFDGFLEELGVKNVGNKAAIALKKIFDSASKSDSAYYSISDLELLEEREITL